MTKIKEYLMTKLNNNKVKEVLQDIIFTIKVFLPVFILGFVLIIFSFCFYLSKSNASERPNWQMVEIEYCKNENCDNTATCAINTRNYILYNHGEQVLLKKKHNNCIVVKGEWMVPNDIHYNKITLRNTKDIEIDHIVPWSYLKRRVEPQYYDVVFNLECNLEPVSKSFNRYKSNNICMSEKMCEKQYFTCIYIQTELRIKNIKNTIDCDDFRQ